MTILTRAIKNGLLIGCIASSLSACSVFSPVKMEPHSKYVLQDTPVITAKRTRHSVIMVAPITTDPAYDTTAMAYVTHPYELNYFVKNEWAELPSKMLEVLLVKTLTKTHHYRGVMMQPTYARYDYILNTHLLTLKQVFIGDTSYYQVTARVDLIQAKTAKLVASKDFSVSVRAMENNPRSGAIAANKAVKKMLKQVAAFCVGTT